MKGILRDKTIALAGVFQTASLVRQIGYTGLVDLHDMTTVIRSLFQANPESAQAVFGSLENLRSGLQCMIEQLNPVQGKRDLDIARYVINLLHLERKLRKNKTLLALVQEGLEKAQQQSEHFTITHSNVLANLAGLYSNTVSKISPLIMVVGDQNYLSSPSNVNKIRALLLAGIRSAVLWSQVGGSRWQILFARRHFIREAKRILSDEIPCTIN